MQGLRKLTNQEMEEVKGGEAITLTAIMAVLAIAIVAVVCYKFFVTSKGKVDLPGGFKFEWSGK